MRASRIGVVLPYRYPMKEVPQLPQKLGIGINYVCIRSGPQFSLAVYTWNKYKLTF
jgi:hypothetical protein